ncbi:MAG: hypothetical protein HYZ24_01340 [Chloroflexi bacterium]|nr:hypothetical protein [Chloroflexota bacterium]
MNKTFLSILIALVFVFGAAGVTVAAAQQSQPGEALFALRTWSRQILHQQEKTQIHARQTGTMIQTRSDMHEQETFPRPESSATLDPCNQSGANGQCGSDQGTGVHHENEHQIQEENGTGHRNDGTNHQNDGAHDSNHESEHGHEGHD